MRYNYNRWFISSGWYRMITVALDPEPGLEDVYYPVTAHPAGRKERRRYKEAKEVENETEERNT